MKVSENFDLKELVHPDIYNHRHIGDRAKTFLNPQLAPTLESLKSNLSELIPETEIVTVNNWHFGGQYKSSGLRPDGDIGARLSGHKFGGTADVKFKHHTPEEVYYHILNNQDKYPYIIRMESIDHTPGWLHIEVDYERRVGEIEIFSP